MVTGCLACDLFIQLKSHYLKSQLKNNWAVTLTWQHPAEGLSTEDSEAYRIRQNSLTKIRPPTPPMQIKQQQKTLI